MHTIAPYCLGSHSAVYAHPRKYLGRIGVEGEPGSQGSLGEERVQPVGLHEQFACVGRALSLAHLRLDALEGVAVLLAPLDHRDERDEAHVRREHA